jgi:hypothetical protein
VSGHDHLGETAGDRDDEGGAFGGWDAHRSIPLITAAAIWSELVGEPASAGRTVPYLGRRVGSAREGNPYAFTRVVDHGNRHLGAEEPEGHISMVRILIYKNGAENLPGKEGCLLRQP